MTHAPSVAVRATDLTKIYGSGDTAVRPLKRLSLEIPAARFTAVMGPSGSGKSTLMHVLAGLDVADGGSVVVGDVELTGLEDKRLTRVRRERLGFIFQAYNLVPAMTAEENILLPSRLGRTPVDRQFVDLVVERLGLTGRLHHRPFELSGGQQQRVAVARALVSRPEVIFADEPTGNLDQAAGAEVLELLRAAVDEFGQTVIMVTHDAAAAARADRTVLLADGQVVDTLEAPTAEQLAAAMIEAGR
ncbi:ABC transporter ATP-binding protein [Nesterenkonia sp. HG001]|uniref:ABC transporter ATP-binding protein n=1 Tax=Nesterenkonia sp. HG001 TaxID=2983207 RepID=UPI002AC6370D|nr:ABC transporter ATP-binding protein [Nesterenkonia sp. HG001]MDZ5078289.1 ABC transporter ATP-binding protein [Nesterenkonia sp. HG001]